MPPKKNPLKLNKLQLRTLALAQLIAQQPEAEKQDTENGPVTLIRIPHPHGDHFHIGQFTVSSRDASGLHNISVWTALARKGLVRPAGSNLIALTEGGVAYDTGFGDRLSAADHEAH